MQNLLENEQYTIKSKCPKCGLESQVKILGAFVNSSKTLCYDCNEVNEIIEVKPVRQLIME